MADCILVEVSVPAAQLIFEVCLPSSFTITQIKMHLFDMLSQYTKNDFIYDENSVLFFVREACVLVGEQSIEQIGLINGDEIIIW